ncbi:hypothetical protein GC167_00045 [bacterium]|nr:hypothetical protein [bacterium]
MIRSLLALYAALCFSALKAQTDTARIRVWEDASIGAKMQAFTAVSTAKLQSVKGYRIQIFNGSRADATEQKIQFARRYPDLSVYTVYETPEYRVQAGDFTDSFEAEKTLREVRAFFPGSFLVRTQVNPRR